VSMEIGVLGTGSVGSSLATGFADAGYDVMLGSRDVTKPGLAEWAAGDAAHRRVSSYRDAASYGEIVILAVPGRVLGETLDATGRESFSDAIVIDASNPIALSGDEVIDAFGDDDSGAEFVQRELPGVPVVKAFNQIMAPAMTHPEKSDSKVLRIAGDDDEAKRRVAGVLEGFGWDVHDLGPLSKARALEHGVVDWMKRSRS
jgi:8-hydroxy-5-deazaflavin:NADPH oxidoreductase